MNISRLAAMNSVLRASTTKDHKARCPSTSTGGTLATVLKYKGKMPQEP
jgi:hypothetical protein